MEQATALRIWANDLSGQKEALITDAPPDETIGSLEASLISDLKLPRTDPEGQAITYTLRNERTGELLEGSAAIGDVLDPEDRTTVVPSIMAGGGEV